jgi:hypothetical protein
MILFFFSSFLIFSYLLTLVSANNMEFNVEISNLWALLHFNFFLKVGVI